MLRQKFKTVEFLVTGLVYLVCILAYMLAQAVNLDEDLVECAASDLEAGHFLAARRYVVRLIEDNHRVLVIYLEVFPNLLIDKIVVGHEDKVGLTHSVFDSEVGAELVLNRLFVNLLDIHRLP